MRVFIALVSALALTACSKPASTPSYRADTSEVALVKPSSPGVPREYSDDVQHGPEDAAAVAADAAASASVAAGDAASTRPIPIAGSPALAYSYAIDLAAPPREVRGLMARHEAACLTAGPSLCQVTESRVADSGPSGAESSGTLVLRAEPRWLKRFRDGLDRDARSAHGRVVQSTTTSEDLSRQIVDTSAALRAKTALRDRLQSLLDSHPGKLSDLLEVERALAEVQAEIDSANSELAQMKNRVATSDLTLNYRSGASAPGVLAPLGKAFGDFFGILSAATAGIVRLVAWVLPWVAVGGLILWLLRKRLRLPRWPFERKPPPAG